MLTETELALAVLDTDGWGCAITTAPATAPLGTQVPERRQAAWQLAEAGYPVAEVQAILAEADRFPCTWAYAPDRRRCAVHYMPAGVWEVRDCEATERRIAALGTARRQGWRLA